MKLVNSILLLLLCIVAKAQNKVADSLIKKLNTITVDSQKVKLFGDISWELLSSDINMSLAYAEKELELATKINSQKDIAQAESDIGNIYNRKADYPNALVHYYRAVDLRLKLKQPVKVAGIYTNIATVMMRQNKFKEALEINFKSLKIFEDIGDVNKQALVLSNIGNLYYNLKQNKQALYYFTKALALSKQINNKLAEANVSVNIADLKYDEKNYTTAEYYYRNALKIYEEADDKYSMAAVYNNLGNILTNKNDFAEAIKYFNLSLQQRILLEDDFGIAQTHSTIGELNKKQKKYQEALQHFNISLEIFKKTNSTLQLEKIYRLLAETYQLMGDLNASLKNYKLFIEIKDSIYEKDLSQQFVEMNTKYDTEKKQKQNELLTTKNKLSEETIKEQKVFSYFIITALLLLSGLAYFIFRGLKQQKKAYRIISKQKEEVHLQKTIIEEHQKETIDSINYAKRIQYALLANKELMNQNLLEHFVLFNPKDIVSGDFYWATKHNNKFYLAVCDSTGHGVPGAFMCILNMGFLSEAIKEKNISKPNEILNYVRGRLIECIGNDGQQDGMDAILICIDNSLSIQNEAPTITYCAANNEPILIRDNQILILPKDKMPVGKGERTDSFTLQTINCQKGDTLYLYTDGYADQFGGPKGKKFKYKPLNELLLSNIGLPMIEQQLTLEENLKNWMGNLEQVDDVCIVGIKI